MKGGLAEFRVGSDAMKEDIRLAARRRRIKNRDVGFAESAVS